MSSFDSSFTCNSMLSPPSFSNSLELIFSNLPLDVLVEENASQIQEEASGSINFLEMNKILDGKNHESIDLFNTSIKHIEILSIKDNDRLPIDPKVKTLYN